MLDDLVQLSRLGRQDMLRRPVDFNTLVEDVVSRIQSESEDRVIDWVIEPLTSIPEIDDVVRYLDANLTKLNVNAADADEIGSVLDVPDVVSAAIVARRKELGRFKSLAEIAAVPGVDARRLEHRRPRISF